MLRVPAQAQPGDYVEVIKKTLMQLETSGDASVAKQLLSMISDTKPTKHSPAPAASRPEPTQVWVQPRPVMPEPGPKKGKDHKKDKKRKRKEPKKGTTNYSDDFAPVVRPQEPVRANDWQDDFDFSSPRQGQLTSSVDDWSLDFVPAKAKGGQDWSDDFAPIDPVN